MIKELDDDLVKAIKSIVEHFRDEDLSTRYRQVRNAKKLKYYWDGVTTIYNNGVAHDWQVWPNQFNTGDSNPGDALFYDKNINVFKAYLETIIAALSVTSPTITAYPDDADNSDDVTTARCAKKIFELIARHQDVTLLWIHSLFIYCTEGLTWSYNYTRSDSKYGEYEENVYEDVEEESESKICSICKTNLVEEQFTNQLVNEFDPSVDDVMIQDLLNQGKLVCPQCADFVDPEIQKQKIVVQKLVGKTTHPKSRECIEVYGCLNVKSPTYARNMEQMPYIQLADEINVVYAIELFPDLYNNWNKGQKLNAGSSEAYQSWMRTSTQYLGSEPENQVTRERTWLRCMAFNNCVDEKTVEKLKKLFPFGCKVTCINDKIVEVEAENLDDHWTPTVNPNADFLQFTPLGDTLVSIQDITRDLVSLTLQTIEHGIPQTFADPGTIDFNSYQQMETKPGMIYPAKAPSGKSLTDNILTLKTATLGNEVLPFGEKINDLGQMTSGALPSLSGGAADNSSKTAAQYSMSRAQAMQRLRTSWTMTSYWWKNTFSKVIPAYIKCVSESGDERFVKKNESGDFINVMIRKSELQGKIGSIELEASDELPTSFAAKKELIMGLLASPNPVVFEAITSPQNLPALQEVLGLNNFTLPGQLDRDKQLEEIKILLETEPIINPMDGQENPSVEIEPEVDNNALEAEVCKEWLKSDAGRLAKIENPAGYKNVLLHMMHHKNIMKMMAALEGSGPQQEQQQQNKPALPERTPDERTESVG